LDGLCGFEMTSRIADPLLGHGPVGFDGLDEQLAAPYERSTDYRRPANERHPFLSVGPVG
jgi:hypothetical protein